MALEYKTVGAPLRGRRKRGAKSRSDKVAAALQEVLDREAVDGWQYLRTDLIPIEERRGWFGRAQEVHRAVMVFCRETGATQAASGVETQAAPALTARPDAEHQGARPPLRAAGDPPATGAAPLVAAPLRPVPGQEDKD